MENPDLNNGVVIMRDGIDIPGKKEPKIDFKEMLGKIETNENLNPNSEILSQVKENYTKENNENIEVKKELTDEEKQKIKEETGWSDGIVDYIRSMKEYEIYKNAGLEEREINGKKCLIKKELDFYEKNPDGKTNKERIEENLSPLGKDGKSMELHHIGQRADSPLAELTYTEHRKNYKILHDDRKKSEIDRNKFADERNEHWRNRSEA